MSHATDPSIYDVPTTKELEDAARDDWMERDLQDAIARYEAGCKAAGGYMPALATRLRIIADDLADRYPDDTNGGRR